MMSPLAPVVMVQGTASSVGKSTLVAGLCRVFARRGVRVAPFKAQNMSNNAAVCADGGEIGRAQFAQAIAARIEPTVDMNPVLLKPQPGGSQLVVRGQIEARLVTSDYFRGEARTNLWPIVVESLERLRAAYDLVIVEGAGSPAEINLRHGDIVNMSVALHADAHVLLVADIDRGGAFASLLGTWQWLAPAERALVRGFVLNKFRGDSSLLEPAPSLLTERTGVPVVGVVPFIDDIAVPEEDAASLSERGSRDAVVEIGIIRLPHIANFDEFGPLSAEHGVHVRWVTHASELRAPDLVIVPGSKATIADLFWLRERGLGERIRWLVAHGTPLLGICGGYQMLGRTVRDPQRIESEVEAAPGLEVLPIETELLGEKRLSRTPGVGRADLPGVWRAFSGMPVEGYEIHMGRTVSASGNMTHLFDLGRGRDGAVSADGLVAGTYLHGVLENGPLRAALLVRLAAARGLAWHPPEAPAVDAFDRLADVLEGALDLSGMDYDRRADAGPVPQPPRIPEREPQAAV